MKHLKILGPLALAAAAMMSFAASASADYLSTTTGGAAGTPTIHAVNESSHVNLEHVIATISCKSTAEGTVTSHGAGAAAGIPLAFLSFTGCTNSWHVTTEEPGYLQIESTSGHNGTVIAWFTRVHATRFGVDCYYEAFDTDIGTLTGGNPATLDIEASIPLDEAASDALCGSGNADWQGAYVTTSALFVNNS